MSDDVGNARFIMSQLINAHRRARRARAIHETYLTPVFEAEDGSQFDLSGIGLSADDLVVLVQQIAEKRLRHEDGVLRGILMNSFGIANEVIDAAVNDALGPG